MGALLFWPLKNSNLMGHFGSSTFQKSSSVILKLFLFFQCHPFYTKIWSKYPQFSYIVYCLLHTVPESQYSFRFRFSWISVFYDRKFKKIREIAEFIPNQLRFHEKNLANFRDMEISLVILPCHFIGWFLLLHVHWYQVNMEGWTTFAQTCSK